MKRRGKKAVGLGILAALILAAAGGFYGKQMGREPLQEGRRAEPEPGLFRAQRLPEAGEEERGQLAALFGELAQGDLEAAARRLEEQGDIFAGLYYETMGGGLYRFDGKDFREALQGRGMVLAGPSLVFYGDFGENGPEGDCLALQAVSLNAPRYDYAKGNWQDGRMEGEGETGYCYYEEIPQGEPALASRRGNFSQDRMEGEVSYGTQDQEGTGSQWELRTAGGVIQTDPRWEYDEQAGEYRLLSQDGRNEYVVAEGNMEDAVWRNLLVWPGEQKGKEG